MSAMWKKTARLRRFALLFLLATAIIVSAVPGAAAETAGASGEPVLIIDPGHGGMDGGAVAPDGTKESDINLSISLKLREMCLLFGIPYALTRDSDALAYPPEKTSIREKKMWDQHRRAEQINAYENAVLISIHQNNYPDARPSGTQVLYASGELSAHFGEITHELMRCSLCPENRRVPAPARDSIYLMQKVRCPAVLMECGFLSNPAELSRLKSPEYQTGIAAILLAGYCQFTQCTNKNPSPEGETQDERKDDLLLHGMWK